MSRNNCAEILLIEDNPGDVDLAREYFEQNSRNSNLTVMNDGARALDYLRTRNGRAGRIVPDLVILDLNLTGLHGLEVLSAIKSDRGLKAIPVIIFSASDDMNDIQKSYERQANCYITKPLGFDEYTQIFKNIENFWLQTVRLPGSVRHGAATD